MKFLKSARLELTALLFPLILSACPPFIIEEGFLFSFHYAFTFSVKNETNADISLSLTVGKIPSPNARYDEFTLIPDEVFQLGNERWSNELESSCTVSPKKNNAVHTYLPLRDLGTMEISDTSEDVRWIELKKQLLNQLISFIFTVQRDGEIVYRIAGWDLPEEDMAINRVDETYWGYYDTAEDNWIDGSGNQCAFPKMYSKVWPQEYPDDLPDRPTYYLKVLSADSIQLQEFTPWASVSNNDYWKKH
ncbi:MAG: hypothetical protein LBG87_03840 [Spirochaetaceae bacterium]|jgi:hypothetical protein|nr:hypothetical protein [Spirochaetaceae bacterium]